MKPGNQREGAGREGTRAKPGNQAAVASARQSLAAINRINNPIKYTVTIKRQYWIAGIHTVGHNSKTIATYLERDQTLTEPKRAI